MGHATTPKTHVLILGYTCSQIRPTRPLARFCNKTDEWSRHGLDDDLLESQPLDRLGLSEDDVDFEQAW